MKFENLEVKVNKIIQQIGEINFKVNDAVKLLMIGSGGKANGENDMLDEK